MTNDTSTTVEAAPTVQVFQVAETLPPHTSPSELEWWTTYQEERLAMAAFRQGYGLVEKPRRKVGADESWPFGPLQVMTFKAMGVKLHG